MQPTEANSRIRRIPIPSGENEKKNAYATTQTKLSPEAALVSSGIAICPLPNPAKGSKNTRRPRDLVAISNPLALSLGDRPRRPARPAAKPKP